MPKVEPTILKLQVNDFNRFWGNQIIIQLLKQSQLNERITIFEYNFEDTLCASYLLLSFPHPNRQGET